LEPAWSGQGDKIQQKGPPQTGNLAIDTAQVASDLITNFGESAVNAASLVLHIPSIVTAGITGNPNSFSNGMETVGNTVIT
jgi:hypothetical protein